MSHGSRSLGILALTVTFTCAPIALMAQDAAPRRDSTSCPPGAMTDWQIMFAGMVPYGMMAEGMTGGMMGPGMLEFDVPMGMPDRELMMEVMEFQPNRVIALQKELGLEPVQIERIEDLVADRWDAERQMRADMEAAVKQLRTAVDAAEPDTAAVRRDALAVAARRDALYAEMVVTAAASRRLLTEQQRKALLDGPCGLHHVSGAAHMGRRP